MTTTLNYQDQAQPGEETDVDRLGGLLTDNAVSLDLVSALAGDRPMTEFEKAFIDDLKKGRADKFYSDLIYAVTHQFFPPAVAENLWNEILRHKYEMSEIMSRNIGIAVASLDYLSNLKSELHSPTVIDEKHIAEIVRLTLRDGLTRLFNHTTCYQKIDLELRRFARYGTMVSIMMCDIDDFKEINDRYGHQEGDKILAMLGVIIEGEARDSDICCRYGGEEFTVILPSTGIRDACIFAERLRESVEFSMPLGRKVTLSIGVASCGHNARTSQSLIEKADSALYHAKNSGKNQVIVITETGSFESVDKKYNPQTIELFVMKNNNHVPRN
jgi:diguanylate cyclase (GGDEF)-like protein